MSQIPENRRSADQAYSHRRQCADNWRPSCSCAAKFAGRMANNTATGALSRTRGSPAGAWCSGTCCIWARSTIRQELAWRRSIEVLEDGAAPPRTLSLFPEDRCAAALADASTVHVKLSQLQLRRPRQWGACWLALTLWRELPRPVLVEAVGVEPQRDALGSGSVRAGRLPPAGAGQRVAPAP